MRMKISELLNAVGDENVRVQYLHHSMIKANICADRSEPSPYVAITFGTYEVSLENLGLTMLPNVRTAPKKIAVIVWVDEERYNDAYNALLLKEEKAK
jgi:hypothetical protein